jgi:D-alanine-D-alanine ligase-like ATP-grasp enzyme
MVIDVNGTPTLTEKASLPYMAAHAGFSFTELIKHILDTALERVYGRETSEITG